MTTTPAAADPASMMGRWWRYQAERFPLIQHGLLILAFSSCAVLFSAQLREPGLWPAGASFIVAFVTCLLFFLQLRIADEFKDYEEDLRHRPYRPVQRGLVSLKELGSLFVITAVVQLALALWLDWRLLGLLLITWVYLTGMSKEFGVGDWLRARPVLYMTSHMVIMPLIDLYATGCDWIPSQRHAPAGLFLFLGASYFNGLVIETGRKIRQPADEEQGVQTYSILWGRRKATAIWLMLMAVAGMLAGGAGWQVGVHWLGVVYLGVWLVAMVVGLMFIRGSVHGKKIELMSGLWTLALYLALGLLPYFFRGTA